MRIMMTLLLLIVGVSIFANGTREGAAVNQGQRAGDISSDAVNITGVLDITNSEVVLVTDNGSYSLSARGGRLLDLSDKDGEEISVQGTLVKCDTCENGCDGHVFVQTAEDADGSYEFGNRGYGVRNEKKYSYSEKTQPRRAMQPQMNDSLRDRNFRSLQHSRSNRQSSGRGRAVI